MNSNIGQPIPIMSLGEPERVGSDHSAKAKFTTWPLAVLSTIALALYLLSASASRAADYMFDTGDVLRVSIFGEEAYPQEVVVDDRGVISLPLLGEVRARERTAADLSKTIKQTFQDEELILNPFVQVEIVRYRPFFISGAVAKPGSYPFQPGLTIRQALAVAGGFRPEVTGDSVPALTIADLRGERSNLSIERYRLQMKLARAQAESAGKDDFDLPAEPPTDVSEHLIEDIAMSERVRFQERVTTFKDEISFLELSLAKTREKAVLLARAREEQASIVHHRAQQLASSQTLQTKGLTTNMNVLELERAYSISRADLAQSQTDEADVQQDILNIQNQLREKRQSHQADLIQNIQDTQIALAKLESELKYLTDKLLFVFYYGKQNSLNELRSATEFKIFRRTRLGNREMAANENTELLPGDVVDVQVVTQSDFYAPDSTTSATPDTLPGESPRVN